MYSSYESSRTNSGRTSTKPYLQYKWDMANYENHKYNLKIAKHNIDNEAPKTYAHLYFRPKKLQLELERFCEIQRDNKSLLSRLATIHKKGGWIDNKNEYEIKSLNTWKRQQEMIQLANDNQTMYKRLLNAQSSFNGNKLEDQYLINRMYEASIANFPTDWRSTMEQMKLMRKDAKKKVNSTRTGRRNSETDRGKRRRTRERIALEAEKVKKAAELEAEVQKRERRSEEEHKEHQQQWKLNMEKWKMESSRWREAREERIRLAKERLELAMEQEKDAKLLEEERQRKWHAKKRLEIEKWKLKKKEEEKKKVEQEVERKSKARENKARAQDYNKKVHYRNGRTTAVSNEDDDSEDSRLDDCEGFVRGRRGENQQEDLNDIASGEIGYQNVVRKGRDVIPQVDVNDVTSGEIMVEPSKEDHDSKVKSDSETEFKKETNEDTSSVDENEEILGKKKGKTSKRKGKPKKSVIPNL